MIGRPPKMVNLQLHPLEVNLKTGEPFLRLRHHKNIILTPPREEDAEAFIPLLNDPRVDGLAGPPYPYTLDNSKWWLGIVKPQADAVLQQLEDAKDNPTLITVGYCPVRSLREVQNDGTDIYIGDLGVMRCMHGELMGQGTVDWANKEALEESNNSIAVGDPSIIWSMGDYLAPSHHRQGIMSDAVNTVFQDWGIPRMNIRRMWVTTFTGNDASMKVFLKNGFKLIGSYEDHYEVKGKIRGLNLLEWKYE